MSMVLEYGDDIDPKPSFWDRLRKKKPVDKTDWWLNLYHSAEEAEAHASIHRDHWKWDGNPAKPKTLHDLMRTVRRRGHAGVLCKGWRNGRWEVLKRWPAGEPLLSENEGEEGK